MLEEILEDPLKLAMAIILVALEVPAATALGVLWVKASNEAKKQRKDGEE